MHSHLTDALVDKLFKEYMSLDVKPIDIVQLISIFEAGSNKNILPLSINDVVFVMEKSGSGWWDGIIIKENNNKKAIRNNMIIRGWFPKTYVKDLPVTGQLRQLRQLIAAAGLNTLAMASNSLGTTYTVGGTTGNTYGGMLPSTKFSHDSHNKDSSAENYNFNPKKSISSSSTTGSSSTNTSKVLDDDNAITPTLPKYSTNPKIVSVEDAERLILSQENSQLYWLPQVGPEGKTLYYNKDLDIYCEKFPFGSSLTNHSPEDDHQSVVSSKISTTFQNDTNGIVHQNLLAYNNDKIRDGNPLNSENSGNSLFNENFTLAQDPEFTFNRRNGSKLVNFFKPLVNKKQDIDRKDKPLLRLQNFGKSRSDSKIDDFKLKTPMSSKPIFISNNLNIESMNSSNSSNNNNPNEDTSNDTFNNPDDSEFLSTGKKGHPYSKMEIPEIDGILIHQSRDIKTWARMKDAMERLLDGIVSSLEMNDQNKFNVISVVFFRLSSCLPLCIRLKHKRLAELSLTEEVDKTLMKFSRSSSQIKINGMLYLFTMGKYVMMKHPSDIDMSFNFSTGIPDYKLNKQMEEEQRSNLQNENNLNYELLVEEYLKIVKLECNIAKHNIAKLYEFACKCDSDKVSNGNLPFPVFYPRFLSGYSRVSPDENPFLGFTNFDNSIFGINKSGSKNYRPEAEAKFRSILDKEMKKNLEKPVDLTSQTLNDLTSKTKKLFDILDSITTKLAESKNIYNNIVTQKKRLDMISLVYNALASISRIVKIVENLDFNVFNRFKISNNGDGPPLAFPIFIEFYEVKQEIYISVSDLIMYSQKLSALDPSIFQVMKPNFELATNLLEVSNKMAHRNLSDVELIAYKLNDFLTRVEDISIHDDAERSNLTSSKINTEKSIRRIRDNFILLLILIGQLIDEKDSLSSYNQRIMQGSGRMDQEDEENKVDLSDKGYLIEHMSKDALLNSPLLKNSIYSHRSSNSTEAHGEEEVWFLGSQEEYDLYYDSKGEIKGGTKEVLVAHLTNHVHFDPNFNKVFLSTFRSMMTPGELIDFLIARFNIQPPEGLSFEEYDIWVKKKAYPIRLRCINVMKMLLQKYWIYAYSEDRSALERWSQFADELIEQKFPSSKIIHEAIQSKLQGRSITRRGASVKAPNISYTVVPPPLEPAPEAIIPHPSKNHKHLRLFDIDPVEFARQLTVKDFELYSQITLLQCLERVWKNKYGLFGGSAHITEFINNSNSLTDYISLMVLKRHDIVRRAKTIVFFISVAEQCRKLNNYSSMTAIISSLSSSPIHRLRKTWALVDNNLKVVLESMNKLMDPKRNFIVYRDMLKYISGVACVPFVGVYLTDLTFIANGTPDYLNGNPEVINFYKRSKMAYIISNILDFQNISYPFVMIESIQSFISKGFKECPSVDSQYQISLILEPRESVSTKLNEINAFRKNHNLKSTESKRKQKVEDHVVSSFDTPVDINPRSNGNFTHAFNLKDSIRGEKTMSDSTIGSLNLSSDNETKRKVSSSVNDELISEIHLQNAPTNSNTATSGSSSESAKALTTDSKSNTTSESISSSSQQLQKKNHKQDHKKIKRSNKDGPYMGKHNKGLHLSSESGTNSSDASCNVISLHGTSGDHFNIVEHTIYSKRGDHHNENLRAKRHKAALERLKRGANVIHSNNLNDKSRHGKPRLNDERSILGPGSRKIHYKNASKCDPNSSMRHFERNIEESSDDTDKDGRSSYDEETMPLRGEHFDDEEFQDDDNYSYAYDDDDDYEYDDDKLSKGTSDNRSSRAPKYNSRGSISIKTEDYYNEFDDSDDQKSAKPSSTLSGATDKGICKVNGSGTAMILLDHELYENVEGSDYDEETKENKSNYYYDEEDEEDEEYYNDFEEDEIFTDDEDATLLIPLFLELLEKKLELQKNPTTNVSLSETNTDEKKRAEFNSTVANIDENADFHEKNSVKQTRSDNDQILDESPAIVATNAISASLE